MINDTTMHESFDAERTHTLLGEGVIARRRVLQTIVPRTMQSLMNEIPEEIRLENMPAQPATPTIAHMAVQQAMPESTMPMTALDEIAHETTDMGLDADDMATPMTYPQPQSIYPTPTAEPTMPAYDREASVRDALRAVQESHPAAPADTAQVTPGTPIHGFLMEHPREGSAEAMPQTIISMPQDEFAELGYDPNTNRQSEFGLAGN